MRLIAAALAAMALAAPALAEDTAPTIQVTGTGKVATPPDIAEIAYTVNGEGKTADEAAAALAAQQKAIAGGVAGLLGAGTAVTVSDVTVAVVRGPGCYGSNGYNPQPRLSEGDCAVIGYLAALRGDVRTPAVLKAATAVGLASRLGARDARVQSYALADDHPARRAAAEAAVADAGAKAAAIAAAAHATLGPIVTIRDQNNFSAGDIVVSAARVAAPPPPPPPAPVTIDARPRPIETQSQVYVVYALVR